MSDVALVTGATGFIGSQVVSKLVASGTQVRCAVRKSSDRKWLSGLEVHQVELNLADKTSIQPALDGVATVYHVAGLVAGTHSQLMESNATCTRNLAQVASEQSNPPTFVHVSSLAAAGPSTPERPRKANDPCQPVSNYGTSKLCGEQAVLDVADRMPTSIVRPSVVFGPRDRELVQLLHLIRAVRFNPLVGTHDPPIGWVHIDDLVHLILDVANRGSRLAQITNQIEHYPREEGIYFASHPSPLSFRNLGLLVRDYIDRPGAWTIPLPISVAKFAALVSEGISHLRKQRTVFNMDKVREAAQPAWTCDVSRPMSELGWQPRSIDEGFRDTIQWYYENKWL